MAISPRLAPVFMREIARYLRHRLSYSMPSEFAFNLFKIHTNICYKVLKASLFLNYYHVISDMLTQLKRIYCHTLRDNIGPHSDRTGGTALGTGCSVGSI